MRGGVDETGIGQTGDLMSRSDVGATRGLGVPPVACAAINVTSHLDFGRVYEIILWPNQAKMLSVPSESAQGGVRP